MTAATAHPTFQALDACHQQIQIKLTELADLLALMETSSDSDEVRRQAKDIEQFFSSTSRDHHAEEEKNIFPALLASPNADLVHAVRVLQQDHGWIEQNWVELAPMLRAIAEGEDWADLAEIKHYTEVFINLLNEHIVREETEVYPAAKSGFAQEMAAR